MVTLIDCDLHSSENLKLTQPIPVTLHPAGEVSTAKYDRRGEETKRRAVQCLKITD